MSTSGQHRRHHKFVIVGAGAPAFRWQHVCAGPGEFAGFLEADTSLAANTGLVCRPVTETVDDTWQ
jgi:hypothetical protein